MNKGKKQEWGYMKEDGEKAEMQGKNACTEKEGRHNGRRWERRDSMEPENLDLHPCP